MSEPASRQQDLAEPQHCQRGVGVTGDDDRHVVDRSTTDVQYGCRGQHVGEVDPIFAVEREAHRGYATLEAELATARTAPSVVDLETRRMEREARERIGALRGLMTRNPTEARKVLEAILDGPLIMTPTKTKVGRRYDITGRVAVANLTRIGSVPKGTFAERLASTRHDDDRSDSVPSGIRTRVTGVKGQGPGPD